MTREEIDRLDIGTLRKIAYACINIPVSPDECPMENVGEFDCRQFRKWIAENNPNVGRGTVAYRYVRQVFADYCQCDCPSDRDGCWLDFEVWKIVNGKDGDS